MSWVWWIGAAWAQQTICGPEHGTCDHPTILDAIGIAEASVPIEFLVLEGSYVEDGLLVSGSKQITLRAQGTVTVRAATDASTFVVLDGASLQLEGLTLSANDGRAARVAGGTLVLQEVVVFTLGVVGEGAGVLISDGVLRVSDSLFLDSVAASGGGHVSAMDSLLVIERTQFLGGTAGRGGALELIAEQGSSASFTDVRFQDNLALLSGGAIYVEGNVSLQIAGGSFQGNFAQQGGALTVDASPDGLEAFVSLDGVELQDNEANDSGGAIAVLGSRVQVDGGALIENIAGGQGGGIYVGTSGELQLERALLCANEADRGGAVRSEGGQLQRWSNNRFVDNQALQSGGAIEHGGGTLEAYHNNFLGNQAPIGAAVQTASEVVLQHNLVALSREGVALKVAGSGEFVGSLNLAWLNALGDGAVPPSGYLAADPRLDGYTPGAGCGVIGDFYSWYGPLVDAGDMSVTTDLDGSQPDIGAYGGPQAPPEPWETDGDGDGFSILFDCDEDDPTIHPDRDRLDGRTHDTAYDGIDSDCDEGDDFDQDRDGYPRNEDCDDDNAAAYPGAPERAGDPDLNCDGLRDADGDGVDIQQDCDDSNRLIHPGVVEDPDPSVDRDCDGIGDVQRGLVPVACRVPGGTPTPRGWGLVVGILAGFMRRR